MVMCTRIYSKREYLEKGLKRKVGDVLEVLPCSGSIIHGLQNHPGKKSRMALWIVILLRVVGDLTTPRSGKAFA